MRPFLYLDTETTGFDEPRLIEVGYLQRGAQWPAHFRVRPPKPIELQAMMVHDITEADVEHLPLFQDHPKYPLLRELIAQSIVVAHHAPYDIEVLNREGLFPDQVIDSKALAQRLYPELEMHKQQYLRYALNADVPGARAHTAGGDVMVLRRVFEKLMERELETSGKSREEAISALIHTYQGSNTEYVP